MSIETCFKCQKMDYHRLRICPQCYKELQELQADNEAKDKEGESCQQYHEADWSKAKSCEYINTCAGMLDGLCTVSSNKHYHKRCPQLDLQPKPTVVQLQAELDKKTKAFKILSPYHGKTNPEGRQEAIKSCIKFIEDRYPKCDAEAVCDCMRCNVGSLAGWMSDIIKAFEIEALENE